MNIPHIFPHAGLKPAQNDDPDDLLGRFRRTLLLSAACCLFSTFPTLAQQTPTLRGNVQEDVLGVSRSDTALLPASPAADAPADQGGIPSPAYSPSSPGAITGDDDDSAAEDDLPALERSPASSRTTARQGATGETPADPAHPQTARTTAAISEETTGSIAPDEAYPNPRLVTVDALEGIEGRAERQSPVQEPIEGRTLTPDEDPFAPTGFRIGTFTLRPSIEQGLRATTNAQSSSTGSDAVLSETTLRLNGTTDWSRHSAFIDGYGRYAKSISGEDYSDPQVNIRTGMQLDLSEQTTVNGEVGYRLRQESASAPTFVTGAVERPNVHEFNGQLGVSRDLGLLFGGVRTEVRHTLYGDAELEDGSSLSQKDRDATFASIALRGGFEMSPAIRPFAEVELGRLIYDEKLDSNGYERSGTRLGLRGGVELDMGEKWSGELALGYLSQSIDDSRLDSVDGLSVDAALNWSPMRGTDVRFEASTEVEGATAPGDSGSILYLTNLNVTRQVRADLSLNAGIGAYFRDNKDDTGLDRGFQIEAGGTYWFNRFFGLNGSVRHEFVKSDVASREYDASSVYLGVTLRR